MNKTLPFEYCLRESSRARRARLRVTPEHGLEVIVPAGFRRVDEIPRWLEQKQRWIRSALERAEQHRGLVDPREEWQLPTFILLPAVGRAWEVGARETDARGVALRNVGADALELRGRVHDVRACRLALGRWLTRQAREHLVPRLHVLGQQTGLRHRHVSVRRQKTRWASCSCDRAISLNVKLLFLPPALAEYVLLHELCHTVELNHSQRFWALVQRHCADYRERDALLRDMWERVPRWAR